MKRLILLAFAIQLTACGGGGSGGGGSFAMYGKWQFTGNYCVDTVDSNKCDFVYNPFGCGGLSTFFDVDFAYDGASAVIPLIGVPTVYGMSRADDQVTLDDGRQFRIYNKSTDKDMAIIEWNPGCRLEFERQ